MRPGGDDEYGLPRVDVVIPDDARELDADLAEWRREERLKRREERLRRLLRPFARHGPTVPVLVFALLITVLGGVLVTVFGPRPDLKAPAAPLASPTAAEGEVGGRLPAARVLVNSAARTAGSLRPAVLVILPPGCACEPQVRELARQAAAQSLHFYLLTDRRAGGLGVQEAHRELRPLVRRITETVAGIIDDPDDALASAYRAQGLTVVTVRRDGLVSQVLRGLEQPINPHLIKA
jgi:hypothetical protein